MIEKLVIVSAVAQISLAGTVVVKTAEWRGIH
jgi:hypothetical protein